jgi:cysteinyl-tRNA synthetase
VKIQDMMDHLCGVLGVAEIVEEEVADEDVAKIEELIAQRAEAKKAKDFAKADAIRDELVAMGITIKDTRQGVQWFRG